MPLTPGTRLGPYEIVAPLGQGGMGEVYRTKDTRLGRDVAVKVLPRHLSANEEVRARFEHEAKTVSSLNHPNICTLFDVGREGDTDFLVMELVDGETLAQRLTKGALPIPDVLRFGAQIADALDCAHRAAVIHRDLKPGNVMLTKSGAKLMDFGLARATGLGPTNDMSSSPTVASPLTAEGTIIGTFQYMAPEQLEGQEVDTRADVWALGCVIHEMATGKRAFDGKSQASLITAIMGSEPAPISQLSPLAPAALDRLVAACLAKDPADRIQSAHDVKLQLSWMAADGSPTGKLPLVAATPRPRPRLPSIGLAAVLFALVLGAVAGYVGRGWRLGHRSSATREPWSDFTQLTDASGVETGPSISPDGTSFAYSSAARGSWDIYVQRVGGRNPVLVAGDPNRDEVWPAFSPDGKLIAFNQGGGKGGIFIGGATGESVRRLTDFGSNPAWSPDSQHLVFCTEEVGSVYARNGTSTLWTVELNGGAPVKIDDGDAIQPAWSPAGKRIAFWQNPSGQRDLATIPAGGGARVAVTSDVAADWAPVWSPDGRFLYFASDRGGSMGIWRIGIDQTSGRPTGAPEPVAVGVDVSMDLPHLSADGTSLVFRSMIASVNPAAIAFDPAAERAGNVTLLQHRTGILVPYDVSADGKWLALGNLRERQEDVFLMGSDGTQLSRVTDDPARDRYPRFSPDGTMLTFYSNRGGKYQGWSIRRDGGDRILLTGIPEREVNYTVLSPDGQRVLAVFSQEDWMIGPAAGPLTPQSGTLTKAPHVGGGIFVPVRWSRDGRCLTGAITMPSGGYAGNALCDVASGTVKQLSDDAAAEMAWMPDRTRVLYFTLSGKLMIQDTASLERHEIDVKLPLPPDVDFSIVASPDGRTIYYGAQQTEANIWKVEPPKAVKK